MDVKPLMDPEVRNFLDQITSHIRSRLKMIVALFLLGLMLGIPLAYRLTEWLLNAGLIPDDVNIIVLTPVEFIMLQVRVGAWVGVGLAVFCLIIDGAWKSGLTSKSPKPGRLVILTVIFSIILAIAGLLYSWYLLTPMLLEYLASDAQSAGLSTEWRLSSFIGFIVSLCLVCIIGFQAPLVTLLTLKSGAVDRVTLLSYRKHIWFVTFVLGAAFSPPDPLSLFLVSIPIILLFEAAIIWDSITGGSTDVNS
jgi:sec-independent protein translocase protein TatC